MNDRDFDDSDLDAALSSATPPPGARLDREQLDRLAGLISPSLRPVRPLAPTWQLALALILAASAVAVLVALRLGLLGIARMNAIQWALVFTALAALLAVAAHGFAGTMAPGSLRRLTLRARVGWACALLATLFALLFHETPTVNFVVLGLGCLKAGVATAIPAGLAGWLILRRGFALDRTRAGAAAGLLGGVAGVAMLELHCPNFQIWHVLVWHTLVVPVSAGLGAMLGWTLDRLRISATRT